MAKGNWRDIIASVWEASTYLLTVKVKLAVKLKGKYLVLKYNYIWGMEKNIEILSPGGESNTELCDIRCILQIDTN